MTTAHTMLGATLAAITLTAAANATFTGFSVVRGQGNPNGNIVWEIRANFDGTGLSAGQQWVFLNAYDWKTIAGSLEAQHSDSQSSWDAGFTNALNNNTDSYVTATGTFGSGTALDPNFLPSSSGSSIPALAGWYDATPGTANLIDSNAMSIKVAQIVRSPMASLFVGSLSITYKASGSAVGVFGSGSFVIPGIPAPGAMALLGVLGAAGRRRR
jgi:hypothetical protein